jgi:hypothetical protein
MGIIEERLLYCKTIELTVRAKWERERDRERERERACEKQRDKRIKDNKDQLVAYFIKNVKK